jgi:multiple sugar transport system permease protein
VILASLIIYPLLFSLINSFRFWNLQTSPVPMGFVGLQNYRLVFQTTPFGPSLRNTLILSIVGIFIEFWFGMGIALLLNSQVRGVNVARALLIMPTTIAPIVAGFLFRYMYYEKGGLITWLLTEAGLPVPVQGILGSSTTALAAIALADIWQWTPFFAIVLFAALLAIPDDIIEAATVDGASGLRMFAWVILPSISRTAVIIIMIRFMQLFNMFDLVLVLTRGGPGTASRTLSYNLYQEGLVNYNIGVAAAMTWLIVIIVTILINGYARVAFRNWEW